MREAVAVVKRIVGNDITFFFIGFVMIFCVMIFFLSVVAVFEYEKFNLE